MSFEGLSSQIPRHRHYSLSVNPTYRTRQQLNFEFSVFQGSQNPLQQLPPTIARQYGFGFSTRGRAITAKYDPARCSFSSSKRALATLKPFTINHSSLSDGLDVVLRLYSVSSSSFIKGCSCVLEQAPPLQVFSWKISHSQQLHRSKSEWECH